MNEAVDTPTFYFFNLGCAKNLVDAQRTADRLLESGFGKADTPAEADLLVITTCAFIEQAERESVDEILRVASAREERQVIAVLGCLASREDIGELTKLLPEIDIFLPVPDMEKLPVELKKRGLLIPKGAAGRSGTLFTPGHLAYLKISEGCGNYCSYCLIPSIRGGLHSVPEEDIIAEAEFLTARGVREIVVIAQDTASWGSDLRENKNLASLLESIREKAGPEWLRVMYLHPAHIDAEQLIKILDEGVILPYLDIPVQHVAGRILDDMGRGYDRAYLEELFGKLREKVPGLVLRTTVMAGYPGETAEEFEQLYDFLEKFELDYAGVFGYSPEEGTRAYQMQCRIDQQIIRERVERISELQMEIAQEKLSAMVGRKQRVLIDAVQGGSDDRITAEGRFYGQCYEVDGMVLLEGGSPAPGSFADVEFESVQIFDLYGRIV